MAPTQLFRVVRCSSVIINFSAGFHMEPCIPQRFIIVKILLKHYTSFIAGLMIVLVIPLLTAAAGKDTNESSCVTCHTDEAALKRLCNIPELHAEAGG